MVQLQYLTVEGLFLTTVTMNVLVSSHLVFKPQDAHYTSAPCRMWKVACYLFQMSFFWNVLITMLFWAFTAPNGGWSDLPTKQIRAKEVIDHSLPLLYTFIDWCLNSIGAQYSQILPNTGIILIYAVINYLYCTISGNEIYPVLTWDNWQAWVAAVGLIPFVALLQLGIAWCTNYKLSKIDKSKWEAET